MNGFLATYAIIFIVLTIFS